MVANKSHCQKDISQKISSLFICRYQLRRHRYIAIICGNQKLRLYFNPYVHGLFLAYNAGGRVKVWSQFLGRKACQNKATVKPRIMHNISDSNNLICILQS
jgi:hypothetical protein